MAARLGLERPSMSSGRDVTLNDIGTGSPAKKRRPGPELIRTESDEPDSTKPPRGIGPSAIVITSRSSVVIAAVA